MSITPNKHIPNKPIKTADIIISAILFN
jgi:hypothetical protein